MSGLSYIFGASNGGKTALRWLEAEGVSIDGFIDNDSSKWHSQWCGLPVIPPHELVVSQVVSIHIASCHVEAISKQLLDAGFDERQLGYLAPEFITPRWEETEIPATLAQRFIACTEAMKARLLPLFHYVLENKKLSWASRSEELHQNMLGRLDIHRQTMIPWLNNLMPLNGARILELGSGSGTSALALAEQGALVCGVGLGETALAIARERFEIYGLDHDFREMNAANIGRYFDEASFDCVIFSASLEHMLIDERLKALESAWCLLKNGGLLVVFETPNRLWFFDEHSSQLPFFDWLPPELALRYVDRSPRPTYPHHFDSFLSAGIGQEAIEHLYRLGRGASYHEFEVALNLSEGIPVESWFDRTAKYKAKDHLARDQKYTELLKSLWPGLHSAFASPYLDLAIRKPLV